MAVGSGQHARDFDPHAQQPVLRSGPPAQRADGALVLLHGRGATAQSILSLYTELELSTVAAIAPRASGNTWYPHSFLAPIDANQPYLDSALQRIDAIVSGLLRENIPSDNIAVLGFSQGACLTSEYVARHPRRYGAVIAFTGGLIGPPGTSFKYDGSLDGTPVFLGTSDPDPHVPLERVEETATIFEQMRAEVVLRTYPGMPHTINSEELAAARALLQEMISRPRDKRA